MGEIRHSWNGTVLTISSDSGTSSCDLKGDTGCRGAQGPAGGAINDVSLIDKTLSIENYAADAKAVGDALNKVSNSGITNTATGNQISLVDSTDKNIIVNKIYGKTTQNGTPTPTAPVPLVNSGEDGNVNLVVTGKNLIKPQAYFDGGVYNTTLDGDVFTSNFKDGALYINVNKNKETALPKGTYTATFFPLTEGATCSFYIYSVAIKTQQLDAKYTINANNASWTFTVDEPFHFAVGGIKPYGEYSYRLQLEVGTASTAYEPYKAQQELTINTPNSLAGIPVTSGGNYKDSTGQQRVCDEKDSTRGIYVQRLIKRILTTASSVANAANGNKYAAIPIAQTLEVYPLTNSPVMSNRYSWNTNVADNTCYIAGTTLIVCDNRFTDLATANAILAEEKPEFIYALKTPIETPIDVETLTAQGYYPNTTIYTDDGAGVEVTYTADTKNYIDNKLAQLTNAIISLGGNF